MNDLKWDDLRAFLAVARKGTLAGAADELNVNPSTVHRRIAGLEDTLGARLFDRDPTGYSTTPVGEALVAHAEEAEEAVFSFRRVATGHDRTATGPVTLTMAPTLIDVIAPCLLRGRKQAPGLRPRILADTRLLNVGVEADIALRPGPSRPEGTVGRRVSGMPWAEYGPRQHDGPPARTPTPWVIFDAETGPAAAVAWQRTHVPDNDVIAEVSSVEAMRSMLRHGDAHGLLPCYVGDPTPELRRVGDMLPEVGVSLWLLIHADLKRSARVRALIDLLMPGIEAARPQLEGRLTAP